jgi:hypothetical protein
MDIVKRLRTVTVAAVLATGLMGATAVQAHDDRIDAGVAVGAFHWGPSPPYYPYYHYGDYGVPVGWPGPFWEPGPVWGSDDYGCHRETIRTGHHRRHVRVCE